MDGLFSTQQAIGRDETILLRGNVPFAIIVCDNHESIAETMVRLLNLVIDECPAIVSAGD